MADLHYCPLTGKFYIIICITIIFSCLLTAINVLEYNENGTDNSIFKVGVATNIISVLLTLYIIRVDLSGTQKSYKSCILSYRQNLTVLFIFTLCSIFFLIFGITGITDVYDREESEYSKMTNAVIASIIVGSMGILYTLNELFVSFLYSKL